MSRFLGVIQGPCVGHHHPGENYQQSTHSPGKTTIDPGVLLTIARLTTLSIEGVNRLGENPGGINRLFKRHQGQGVRIDVQDTTVNVDLFLILDRDTNIRELSRTIQYEVSRAISEMVGMEVGQINIHIEDIDFKS